MNRVNKIFSESLLNWYEVHGRKSLPWQQPQTPYRVWLSEIMLQQTQVQTVIPYFVRFITQFPDVNTLANAHLDDVLTLWAGLGYYSRARNLHQCAQMIVKQFSGQFPDDPLTLQSLPGIGRSTAAAIASLAFERPAAIMDGNVKRVLSRYFLINYGNKQMLACRKCTAALIRKRLWIWEQPAARAYVPTARSVL
jgi:A/G-specific adenine glycosylase